MKITNSLIIFTLCIFLASCFGGSDETEINAEVDTPVIEDQFVEDTWGDQNNIDFGDTANVSKPNANPAATDKLSGQGKKPAVDNNISNTQSEDIDSPYTQYESNYGSADSSYNQYDSGYGNTDSSYDQYNANYGDSNSSYNQDDSGYDNTGSSYDQNDSNYADASSSYKQNNSSYSSSGALVGQDNSSAEDDSNTATDDNQNDLDSEDTQASDDSSNSENTGINYQRVYDNGIIWYGNIGTLVVQYQSPDPETTGIGFRVHFDNSSMRVTSVTSYPVDAISSTSPQMLMSDAKDYDNDGTTNHFLPFAWASIYGQWPQTNQVNLATIEFERIEGGSGNYHINYSPISVAAGFQFVR